jgi:hypothetical protein
MTEMHTPIRAHYVIDAPVERLEAVLARDEVLMKLVRNDWVKVVVRCPYTNRFYEQSKGKYTQIQPDEYAPVEGQVQTMKKFEPQRRHGEDVAESEAMVHSLASAGMVVSFMAPIIFHYDLLSLGAGAVTTDPRGAIIAASATMLSLPTLAFARRYLHGEYMFTLA